VIVVVAAPWVSWFVGGHTLADAAGSYLLTNSGMAVAFSAFGALVWRTARGTGSGCCLPPTEVVTR